jgi:hypothetical protein
LKYRRASKILQQSPRRKSMPVWQEHP